MGSVATFSKAHKYLVGSILLLLGAIVLIAVNQNDFAKLTMAIVTLVLIVASIASAGWGLYRGSRGSLRWAGMATVVASAVLSIFVITSLATSLGDSGASDIGPDGVTKSADVLGPAAAEAGSQPAQPAASTFGVAQAQAQAAGSQPGQSGNQPTEGQAQVQSN